MQRADPQKANLPSQPALSHAPSLASASPQGNKIPQLEAIQDQSPILAAQRELANMIHGSPRQIAQRKLVEGVQRRQPAARPAKTVAQLIPAYKAITGITHLVEMTDSGNIYNADSEENEYAEVSDGDIVQIDTDISYLSRRGPNQEDYSAIDEDGPQHYEWFKVLKLNGVRIDKNVYVRKDTFVPYSEGENLIANMAAMTQLPKMQWNGAGAKEFAEWMGKQDAAEPSEANCWNAILYAAYYANLVDKLYIQRANEGGRAELVGPALARAIVGSPAGSFLKQNAETPEAFMRRFAENQPDIPRGMVVVLHRTGFHVVLSLGGGEVLELDKQPLVTTINPNYNPKYIPEKKKFETDITTLARKAKFSAASGEALAQKTSEFEAWKQNNSRDQSFTKRLDNELRRVSLTPGLNFYLGMLNLDGVYWGALPDL